MEDEVVIEPKAVLDLIGAGYALRRLDFATFGPGHSDSTPDIINDCINNARNGRWLPFLVSLDQRLLALHWMHDMCAENDTTWVGGFVPKWRRGRKLLKLRQLSWEFAQEHIRDGWGFTKIHAYVMASNDPGIRWAEQGCRMTRVGLLRKAILENQQLADVIVYTQFPAHVDACRSDVSRVFSLPPAYWEE